MRREAGRWRPHASPVDLCLRQARPAEISWLAELEEYAYSAYDAVPEEKLREWYQASPAGFLVLLAGDIPIGHINVLPIVPGERTFVRFLAGQVPEAALDSNALTADRGKVKDVYIESIIIRTDPPIPGLPYAQPLRFLLGQFQRIVNAVADFESVANVYAFAATEAGKHIIEALGFSVACAAHRRVDQHDLFRADPKVIAERIARRVGRT